MASINQVASNFEKKLLNATELEDLTYGISNINKRLDEMEDRLFNEIKPNFQKYI